jgi:hypothetical protein
MQDPHGITTERASVIPPFAKAELQVPDGRALDRDLSVVPGRSIAVLRRHRLALVVTVVVRVVAPAVA